jgi:hypothetical protein
MRLTSRNTYVPGISHISEQQIMLHISNPIYAGIEEQDANFTGK